MKVHGLIISMMLATSLVTTQASVTFNVSADRLKTTSGGDIPTTARILLVASTTDNVISEPTSSSFVNGDDVVIYSGVSGTGLAGVASFSVQIIDFANGLSAGDPIALFWYPNLTDSSNSPGEGVSYGKYSPTIGAEADGSAPWVIPADGAVVSLNLVTTV